MSYRDWHVGMKVVCIDDQWRDIHDGAAANPHDPKLNEICTITRLQPLEDDLYIQVEGRTDWYEAAAFRPIQPRKTSIACFTALLNGAKERERV